MHYIPWEKTTDGVSAQHKMNRRPVTKGNFVLKRVALSKMTDISLLSAEFHGVHSFEHVDFSGGTLPDHGCAISYTRSFLEFLSMFPK